MRTVPEPGSLVLTVVVRGLFGLAVSNIISKPTLNIVVARIRGTRRRGVLIDHNLVQIVHFVAGSDWEGGCAMSDRRSVVTTPMYPLRHVPSRSYGLDRMLESQETRKQRKNNSQRTHSKIAPIQEEMIIQNVHLQ
jgi:hypothetical protein